MQQPKFWYSEPGVISALLAPLSSIWALSARIRARRNPSGNVDVPVVCIGNINVGGSGKSPFTVALAQRLAAAGENPHVVSTGYRGKASGPLLVEPGRHDAALVGDEPLLHAEFAPTWVARDRVLGAKNARAAGASAVLLDDGHQDPSLARDLSLLVVDAERGFGNSRVLPAGPLREDLGAGLSRGDLLIVVGSPEQRKDFSRRHGKRVGLPQVGAELKPLLDGAEWQDAPVLAFAGIGHPEKFFATLRSLGAEVAAEVPLGDHQLLSERLLRRLESDARSCGAQLVTTEKDAVRLPARWRKRVLTVPVRIEVEDWTPVDRMLADLGLMNAGR